MAFENRLIKKMPAFESGLVDSNDIRFFCIQRDKRIRN